MQKQSKDRLGRGLTSLLGANYNKLDDFIVPAGEDNKSEYIFQLNIQNIVKNNENPRNKFDEIEIENLKNSIIEHGVLQPIIVRPYIDGKYMIIAGERRWRASKAANLETIPAIIKNINEKKALELAIIENIQREDLNIIEEAAAYKQLIELYNYSQEELAKKIGFSRAHIANIMRLLSLPEEVKQLLAENKITPGHARCLVGREDAISWARKIARQPISVRKLEESLKKREKITEIAKPPRLLELEENLAKLINLDVKIKKQKQGGTLLIKYTNDNELLKFLEKFKD